MLKNVVAGIPREQGVKRTQDVQEKFKTLGFIFLSVGGEMLKTDMKKHGIHECDENESNKQIIPLAFLESSMEICVLIQYLENTGMSS